MIGTAKQKPARGSALLASRERRAERTSHEQAEMTAAKVRDEYKCRVPRCIYKSKQLRIDAAHQVHRGMGGDPRGTRTERRTCIALCVVHHGEYDHGDLDISPLTDRVFDGPCEYHWPASGKSLYERTLRLPEPRT